MAEKCEPKPAKAFQPGPARTGTKDAGAALFIRSTTHSEHRQVAFGAAEELSVSAVPCSSHQALLLMDASLFSHSVTICRQCSRSAARSDFVICLSSW